eukprot:CAMPEP_0174726376 /NCGR_PEP_ID=MMETSP1094-20130205/47686_1 /TAXON_ID=156173 /ORGANISM="Chrysochromulina brevifilum, Strain UTEX LB 985" /LENGTH=69 /DNA_ID=CAMNT_0015927947 /DNA_START=62 /DNA_END=271 /DNA_ORIENTATION=-
MALPPRLRLQDASSCQSLDQYAQNGGGGPHHVPCRHRIVPSLGAVSRGMASRDTPDRSLRGARPYMAGT